MKPVPLVANMTDDERNRLVSAIVFGIVVQNPKLMQPNDANGASNMLCHFVGEVLMNGGKPIVKPLTKSQYMNLHTGKSPDHNGAFSVGVGFDAAGRATYTTQDVSAKMPYSQSDLQNSCDVRCMENLAKLLNDGGPIAH